jgi:hypothetical protein
MITIDELVHNDSRHSQYIGNLWACWLEDTDYVVTRVHNGYSIIQM